MAITHNSILLRRLTHGIYILFKRVTRAQNQVLFF